MGGKKVRVYSGFVGKGFKFDETEENAIKEQRQMQKVSLGLDEEEGNDKTSINTSIDIDKQIEEKFKAKKRIRVKEHYAPLPIEQLMKKKEMENRMLPTSDGVDDKKSDAVERAKLVNARLAQKLQKAQNHAKKVVKSKYGAVTPNTPVSAKTIAAQMAAKLNNKIGYSKGKSITEQLSKSNKDDENQIKEYEEALEINDFPQSVRYKCCTRDTLALLIEGFECRVNIKGRYYEEEEAGPENEDDDPRLYMEIIADSEAKVSRCRAEIARLVKEELLRIQARPLSNLTKSTIGRYKINV